MREHDQSDPSVGSVLISRRGKMPYNDMISAGRRFTTNMVVIMNVPTATALNIV